MKPVLADQLVDRKPWTPEEDNVLRDIVINRKIQNWSTIAQLLEDEFKVYGRNAKQCRQRWTNQLDPNIKGDNWPPEEEKRLFDQHNAHGNKWAKISQLLPGRSDNSIKNHFYCTLRKALRRVNRYIAEQRHKTRTRQIKNSILSKIIAVAQERFQSKLQVPVDLIQKCNNIKNRLIQFSRDQELNHQTETELKGVISDIVDFNRAYKKKKTKKKVKDETGTKQTKKTKEADSDDEDQEEEDEKLPDKSTVVVIPPTKIVEQKNTKSFGPTLRLIPDPAQTVELNRAESKVQLSKSLEFDIEEVLKGGPSYISTFANVQPSSPPIFGSQYEGNSPFALGPSPFQNPFAAFTENTSKFKPIVLKEITEEMRKKQEL